MGSRGRERQRFSLVGKQPPETLQSSKREHCSFKLHYTELEENQLSNPTPIDAPGSQRHNCTKPHEDIYLQEVLL